MNMLQKIESKLNPDLSEETIDKLVAHYLAKDIDDHKVTFVYAIVFCYLVELTCSFSAFLELVLIGFNQYTASSLYVPLTSIFFLIFLITVSVISMQFRKYYEALESGLKRKIENNKGEAL